MVLSVLWSSVRTYRKHGHCLRHIALQQAVTLNKKGSVMSSRRPFLRTLLLLFGSVGIVACIALIVGVWSVIVAVVVTLFMIWMAAGQLALCVVGWRR